MACEDLNSKMIASYQQKLRESKFERQYFHLKKSISFVGCKGNIMFIKNNELGSKIQVLFAFSCEKVDSGLKYGRRWERNLTCDIVVAFPA